MLDLDKKSKLLEILKDREKRELIPVLQRTQELFGYIPKEAAEIISEELTISLPQIYGVVTFYAQFKLEPSGKHIIKICDGTACHVKGSTKIIDALKDYLELGEGEETTEDRLFSLEAVSCLGTCGLAPAMVVDEDVHGLLTPKKAVDIITEIQKSEGK
jgi:NADH-quinone oxidoreductase subunit E